MRPGLLCFAALLALGACTRGGDAPAPASSASAASSVASVTPVDVVLGSSKTVIDGALLARTKPDFDDGEHRGWWLRSLVPGYDPKVAVQVEDADGRSTAIEADPGAGTSPREILIALSKQGELKVTLATANDPFPAFHGRGGNRGRGPDPIRVQRVRRIVAASPSVSAP